MEGSERAYISSSLIRSNGQNCNLTLAINKTTTLFIPRVFSFHFQLHLHTLLYFSLLFHFLSLFPYLFLLIFTLPTLVILSLFHTLTFYACYSLVLLFTLSSSVLPFFVSLFFLPLLKTPFHPIYYTCLMVAFGYFLINLPVPPFCLS